MKANPIFYSFRRCPYCIRAHMVIEYAGIAVELRSILLKSLPQEMLQVSPKATVPVLITKEQKILEESWDIMIWALRQHDPDGWLGESNGLVDQAYALILENDGSFKSSLDRYKYANRFPEGSPFDYRSQCELFLHVLEQRLQNDRYLLADKISLADIGIFPFIRQFAFVDKIWFDQAPYPALQQWLDYFLSSHWFHAAFQKKVIWQQAR